jgi:hypothetical protein
MSYKQELQTLCYKQGLQHRLLGSEAELKRWAQLIPVLTQRVGGIRYGDTLLSSLVS